MSKYSHAAEGMRVRMKAEALDGSTKSETFLMKVTPRQGQAMRYLSRRWCVSPQEALRRMIDYWLFEAELPDISPEPPINK